MKTAAQPVPLPGGVFFCGITAIIFVAGANQLGRQLASAAIVWPRSAALVRACHPCQT
jgi:hypothetical protein